MNNGPQPPRLAARIIQRFASPQDRLTLLGDLHEIFLTRVESRGLRAAQLWYWREALVAAVRLGGLSGGASKRALSDLAQEVRFTLRGLTRSRGFTVVAVLSLAVGIGVNTAVFTAIYAVWLAPVPGVSAAGEVIEAIPTERGADQWAFAYPDFMTLRQAESPLERLAAWSLGGATLNVDDMAQRATVIYASADYFRVLGVIPSPGRDFVPSEDVGPGQHPVVVVSHDLWRNQFEGDPEAVGRTISLNRVPYTVIGVAPEGFRGTRPNSHDADLWVPLMQHPSAIGETNLLGDVDQAWVSVLARRAQDVSLSETNAALRTIFARLALEFPESHGERSARASTFSRFPAQNRMGDMLAVGMLAGMIVMLLLIICANLAGMNLARSATRGKEIAVRLALGSGRGRLVRNRMLEAVLLSLAGGGLGVFLAFQGVRWVTPSMVGVVTPNVDFTPNGAVLAASIGLTLMAAIAFGLAPAIRYSRPELVSILKDDTGGGRRSAGRIHRFAASAQTGVALLLLVVGSLFLRALGEMERRDLGFDPHGLFVASLNVEDEGYPSREEGLAILDRLTEAVAAVPGVESVTLANGIPLDMNSGAVSVSRGDRPEESGGVTADQTRVGEDYFATVGTPILRGRAFEKADNDRSEPVAVITEALAQLLWPGESALGRKLRSPLDDRSDRTTERMLTVVGITPDGVSSRLDRDWPHVFIPFRQAYVPNVMIVTRGSADLATLAGPVREAVRSVDPQLPVVLPVSAESMVAHSTEAQRGIGRIAVGLGLLALLLSAIGVHGVVGLAVSARTREIGLRLAMGGTRVGVLRRVMADALRMAIPGLAVGAVVAAGLAALLRSMLVGLSPADPVSFLFPGGLLLAVVTVASLVPAFRAAAVDPAEALRAD